MPNEIAGVRPARALSLRPDRGAACALLAFAVPAMVRALPELVMSDYVVGFDTLCYYLPVAWDWLKNGIGPWEFVGYAPLFFLALYCLSIAGVPLFVSLKALPPIVHGMLGLAVFLFATKALGWGQKKSLAASLIATIYFVGLRISWDMLRSELGLCFLFVFLIALDGLCPGSVASPALGASLNCPAPSDLRPKRLFLLSVSMFLTVLSHQLVSVVMFAVFLAYAFRWVTGRGRLPLPELLAALPAAGLFAITAYADYAVLTCFFGEPAAGSGSEWLSLFTGGSPVADALNILGFFLFCYLPILPLALAGSRSLAHTGLRAWMAACLIGSAASLFSTGVPLGYRWVLLMHFPFALFASEGLWGKKLRPLRKACAGAALVLSLTFLVLPHGSALPYFTVYPYYFPSSMLQNSVPLWDCDDVAGVLGWAESNLGASDVLLVHDAFKGWALLHAPGVNTLNYGYSDPERVASQLSGEFDGGIFLIWWAPGEGWHGQEDVPGSFTEVYRSGIIVIYQFHKV